MYSVRQMKKRMNSSVLICFDRILLAFDGGMDELNDFMGEGFEGKPKGGISSYYRNLTMQSRFHDARIIWRP
jgi:hypothetical protein